MSELAAGRELDTVIATRIMGWQVHWLWTEEDYESGRDNVCRGCSMEAEPPGQNDDDYPESPSSWHHNSHETLLPSYYKDNIWGVVPSFSENMDDAWIVVEEMHQRGWYAMLLTPFDAAGLWSCAFSPHGTMGWNRRPFYESLVGAGMMPLAICRAALLVVEGKE